MVDDDGGGGGGDDDDDVHFIAHDSINLSAESDDGGRRRGN